MDPAYQAEQAAAILHSADYKATMKADLARLSKLGPLASHSDKMARKRLQRRHQGLKATVKMGQKVAAQRRMEDAKMDTMLASIGLNRDALAQGEQIKIKQRE